MPTVVHMARSLFYYFIAEDVVSAYRDCSEFLRLSEKTQHVEVGMLELMSAVCCDSKIRKFDKALDCIDFGISKTNDALDKIRLQKNKGDIYMLAKQYSKAKEVFESLVCTAPSPLLFYSYAKTLYYLGEYDKAEYELGKYTQIIKEDPSAIVLLAKIRKQQQKYSEAVSLFSEAISQYKALSKTAGCIYLKDSKKAYIKINIDPYQCEFIQDAYIELIDILCCNNQTSEARKVLDDAKETLPDKAEWILAETSIAKSELVEFEKRRVEILRESIQKKFATAYPGLCEDALEAITTAEIWYQEQKRISQDYSSIVSCYCRAFEIQLRLRLSAHLPRGGMELGAIVREIDERRIAPYSTYVLALKEITNIRNKSAHSGDTSIEDLSRVRELLFDKRILNLVSLRT